MIENLLLGSGIKIASNVINTWMANRAEEIRANTLKSQQIIQAQVELAKENNRDFIGKMSRSIIFIMLIGCWCYMGIYFLTHVDNFQEALIPRKSGLFGKVFGSSEYTSVKVGGWSILFYQWFEIMQTVVGFFCVPSRKR